MKAYKITSLTLTLFPADDGGSIGYSKHFLCISIIVFVLKLYSCKIYLITRNMD